MRTILIKAIRYYQVYYSKYTPHCRYTPTCSQYMINAIRLHGVAKGVLLGCLRLLRCNRYGDCGCDPVPEDNAIAICLHKTFGGQNGIWRIDVVILGVTSLLYLFNRLTCGTSSPHFMQCYFNDLCCGSWFMAVTNLILSPTKRRLSKMSHILVYIGLWGVCWETIGPLIKHTAVADIYDIVAYLAGSLVYWVVISSLSILGYKRYNESL